MAAAPAKILSNPTAKKTISPALSRFLGEPETYRDKTVEKIWNLFKRHYPRNPTNKKEIVCDRQLKKIYDGKLTLSFLEFSKPLTPHFVKK